MTMRASILVEADGSAARAEILSTAQAITAVGQAANQATRATTGAAAGIDAVGRAAATANTAASRMAAEFDQAAARIDQTFGKLKGSAAESARAFEEAFRIEADFSNIEAQLNPAIRATREYQAAQELAARAVASGAVTQERASAVLAQAAVRQQAAMQAVTGRSRLLGTGLQQAGFQVGDFATQVQLGVNPLIAFGQQAGQLLGAFGVWGAVIGGAITVVGALATGLFGLGEAADQTKDKSEFLNTAINNFRSAAVTNAEGVKAVIQNYGALDTQIITLIRRQTQLNLALSQGAAREAIAGVGATLQADFPDLSRNVRRNRGGAEMLDLSGAADALGLSEGIVGIVRDRLLKVQGATTQKDQTAALQNLGDYLQQNLGPQSTALLTKFTTEVNAASLALTRLALDEKTAAQSDALLSKPIPELNALAATVGAPKGRGDRAGQADARRQDRVLADLAAEVAANERLTAARLQSADAVRQALVVEAQEQALRRAGLEVADLAGGADQARAQQIAALAGELYAQSDAQKTVTEVTRAYGEIAGTSYADAAAEIERWRTGALASLDAVGQGHEDLVAQIDAIAADRLREAYDADLANRTDWQAGVERGIRGILDEHRSLADEVEDLLGTMSQSGEDAFVQLATTGKVQTRDLVEFALRQFFRLAQQAALSLATGGNGGVLGQIFSSITGIALGAGGSGITGPSGSGVLGAGGIFASAHTGGMVGDAPLTHRLDPAVFIGAPRLHSGGLLPGERPTVLLSDERVLTAAQQENTAQTITGLASLVRASTAATAPRGGGAVTINIYGAPGQAKVSQSETGDGTTIDVLFEQVEGRLASNLAAGRGQLAQAITGRFELRPKGAF